MNAESWADVRTLFYELSELSAAERRGRFERATMDADTRAELERLLALHDDSGSRLDNPAVFLRLPQAPLGSRIGRYTLQRVLGSGGMGTVFEAVQDAPRRTVALKTLHMGFASPERLQRFRFEVEVLGSLRHPSIAQIHEAGTHEAGGEHFPFFAMELVAGARDICTHAREKGLTLAARLELFLQVCAAVDHGHQKGVIHRDLKAGNILVDAEGRPKVIDFGVARATGPGDRLEATTQAGELVGTLSTMSPEQLSGRAAEIDVRTDVYSLGVVLYELLAGRPPYELAGLSLEEAVERVREALPPPVEGVPRELYWVLQHALEKDAQRRYPSASDLAADLRRFLAHEPVSVGPPGARYRMLKLVRRNRLLLGATGAVIISLALGFVRAAQSARAESRARTDAERGEHRARIVSDTLERILISAAPNREGRLALVTDVLDEAARSVADVASQDPAAGATLHKMIGASYAALHETAKAELHLTAARAFAEEHLDPEDPLAIEVQTHWIDFLASQQRWAEVAALAGELLPLADRQLGEQDRHTFKLRFTLAGALSELDRLDEAEAVARENLRRVRRLSGRDERAIDFLRQLAMIAVLDFRFEEARAQGEEALALCGELLPPDNFRTVEVRQLLDLITIGEGRYAEVASSMEGALSYGHAGVGQAGCTKIAALLAQGAAFYGMKDFRRALEAFSRAREECDALYGAESVAGVESRRCVSACCAELGRGPEALRWAEEAVALAERVPLTRPQALKVRDVLAFALLAAGRPAEAEAIFDEILAECDVVFGPANPFVLDILDSLSRALAAQGDLAGVEELALELEQRAPAEVERAAAVKALAAALRSAEPPAAVDPAVAGRE